MNSFCVISGSIKKVYRIVETIGKHIIAKNTLSRARIDISIDESTHLRIVISGLEIVDRGFYFVRLAIRPKLERFYPWEVALESSDSRAGSKIVKGKYA